MHVAYFENVTNAPEIRRRLVAAATTAGPEGEAARAAIDFGFVDAGLVSGVLRALSSRKDGTPFHNPMLRPALESNWVLSPLPSLSG